MTQEDKQKEREYWTKLLADGPVWCEVWFDTSKKKNNRLVIAYVGGDQPFTAVLDYSDELLARAKFDSGAYLTRNWHYATPIPPKPRRPWTAEEIMVHGIFENEYGSKGRVISVGGERVYFSLGSIDLESFFREFRAVCLELRDGILCDTGKRVELYKDGE